MIIPLTLFFYLLCFLPTHCFSHVQLLRGTFIDCGSTVSSLIDGFHWVSDCSFISVGTPKILATPFQDPTLSTVRTFPLQKGVFKKFCYQVPVIRGVKYLVRTTYYYGGVNAQTNPPVFDQMVDGTFWSIVNTTDDYLKGKASYYEAIFMAAGRNMSVCFGANNYTESDPFVSALELVIVSDSLYNATDFRTNALNLVARNSFGYSGPFIRYPDDQFDRYWTPFGHSNATTSGTDSVSVSGFWNLPPLKVFQNNMEINKPKVIELLWPPFSLPSSSYYVSLYFADDRVSAGTPQMFNVTINGVMYYPNLTVTPAGVAVFASPWPLSGQTKISLSPVSGSTVGPLINAGEALQVLKLGGSTVARDVVALERLKESLKNSPHDWNGDPCFPRQYPWSGVTCSQGPRVRVSFLNLTSMNISGFISPYIANLSALSGLDLSNNQLGGEIPQSLGKLGKLRELLLQNNNLTGQVPASLIGKPGLDFRFSGNAFLSSREHKTGLS